MNKKGALFGSLLSCFLLVGCASNDKPSTDNNSSDKTTEESTVTKVNPTAVTLTGDSFVAVKGNLRLLPKFTPENTTEKELTWESSDPTLATVDENGLVTGVKSGDVVITATSKADASVKVSHAVKVILAPSKITIENNKHVNLLVNGTEQLNYTVTGDEGFNNEVEFVVEKPDVIEVSSEGLITAKALGQSEITVKSKYSEKSATITIHVGQAPESIHLFANDDWDNRTAITEPQEFVVAQSIDFGVQYNGENAYYGVKASSNNDKVATVKTVGNNKISVTAVATGTAKITVKSVADESKLVELTVNVSEAPLDIPADGLKFAFGADDPLKKHNDGGTMQATGVFEQDGMSIKYTDAAKIYSGARDEKGNGCIKMGTGSALGKFTIVVPEEVNQVIFEAAKYKVKDSTLVINGKEFVLTKNSNDGQYDTIVIDTSTTKTLNVTTKKVKYEGKDTCACMLSSITLKTQKIEVSPVEPQA